MTLANCRWSFMKSDEAIKKQEFADTLPRASIQDLGMILMGDGYEVFMKGPSLYAFKGLAGRFAPIGVHISMLLIMMLLIRKFMLIDSPWIIMTVEKSHDSQFHSDLSLRDLNGKEVLRKTISVNDPLRYGGVTVYQTDWSFSALQVTKDGEGPFNLAMAPIKINGDKKLYGTFLPVGDTNAPNVKGISMLARDLQSIVVYDLDGKFAGIRRPNSKLPIEINGMKIVIEDAIGSTGLELKTDPGVPVVYAGFGALMLTTCISYLSHSQIWALQNGTTLVVGGKNKQSQEPVP
ncbi:ResB-like domain [Arabidopsis thaliana x Arabidopsis arenosa]|uniref:ResB-like domain n=1 Tax=Arabidopsis thaliana x Arabidopsis arenosa TaxID=1240361 RepID=A0A8T2C9W5_9BRAS|nr:ResB-like domain [Arabidopsis thaliana x Arabidopsis arenosa]